ncbi:F-box and leucine-rich repeat protein 13 isoform X1 [Phycodurus eques]|uniref:F-box and leucine-rich repeat protein 13 isoform X1 n=1 Tax=Phycodurus eques TaxID=693459 RepID=UPI002ACEAC98|nr:F-box and leucine-rich repeat protein 13 isoform X1 [Phycodurus eques]XP_061533126.1 F-box and leucine-rich repeat protein 13 isoform X1 [Phycodurus eques]
MTEKQPKIEVSALTEYELQQLYKALLIASCRLDPRDPIQFLKNTLITFQGHDNLQNVDWNKFLSDSAQRSVLASLELDDTEYMDSDELKAIFRKYENAYSCYRSKLTSSCFRSWRNFTIASVTDATELSQKMEIAIVHYDRRKQEVPFLAWMYWVKFKKESRVEAVRKLVGVLKACILKRIITAWKNVVKESQRTKDYFKRLQNELEMERQQSQIGEGCDWLSALPNHISLKIFEYMELRDLLSCSEVCCSWRSLIHSGTLWSKINVSVDKRWITNDIMKDVLLNFRPFVIHLNLRGCTSLEWSSLKHIGECRNLQELNVSECFNITDAMIESIVGGCNSLLYLNLSSTLLTDATLRELARHCINLQYLSLAYCHKMTDEGFQYLSLGRGCHNLLHLDLSGCSQVTATGFGYISDACPYLREVLLNDVYGLSDNCISALMAKCHCLSSISLLEAWKLSDAGIKAIAEVAKLKSFSLECNNHVSHLSWKALCCGSRGLRRLHIVHCHKMGDTALKSVATLRNLHYLDISLCSKVTDKGLFTLAESPSANKLRELNVSYCCQITDAAISVIGHRFTRLSHLNLSYCEQLTDAALECLMGSSITSLDISGCNIQDDGLAALEEVPLKKLILGECINITDVGMENLCKYVTDLEYVDVSGCSELSDQAIKAFSFYCRGLFTLRMAGCPKMTDMAMQCLSHGAAQYLRELDVSGCTLTDRAIRYIERLCPPLSSITMHGCNRISEEAAMRLQPYVQHWEYSNEQTKLWLR